MATSMMGISALDRLRREWMEQAGRTFETMFAADQQAGLITFTQREEMAMELTRHLAQWLLEEHISADPAAQPSQQGPEQPMPCCPKCGQEGIAVTREADPLPPRTVQSRAGDIDLERQQYKCTTCRVVFFPLGPEVGTQQRRI
jgi:hypothetical protein